MELGLPVWPWAAGTLCAGGADVELVLSVRFLAADAGIATSAFFTIGDRDGVLKADGCTLAWQRLARQEGGRSPSRSPRATA